MPADGLEPGELGCAFPVFYGVAVNQMFGSLPHDRFVRHVQINPQFDVPVGTDNGSPIIAHIAPANLALHLCLRDPARPGSAGLLAARSSLQAVRPSHCAAGRR